MCTQNAFTLSKGIFFSFFPLNRIHIPRRIRMKRASGELEARPILGSRTHYSTTSCLSERTPEMPPIPNVTGTRARRIARRWSLPSRRDAAQDEAGISTPGYKRKQKEKQISAKKRYLKWPWWHDPFFFLFFLMFFCCIYSIHLNPQMKLRWVSCSAWPLSSCKNKNQIGHTDKWKQKKPTHSSMEC